MFSRVLSLALCLVCAPAFAAIITSEVTIGPSDPAASYNVQPTGHLTVLEGATVNDLSVYGGRADILGGNFTDRVWLDDRETVVNVSGGTFKDFKVVNVDTLALNISGGIFTRGVFFDDSGWGGGTVTITGGDLTGGNQALGISFGGEGKITWTAHIRGGRMTGASGIAGNSIHVYGHWLNYHDGMGLDGHGNPIRWQTLTGVLEDGTQFHWEIPGNDSANVYTLHDLGELQGDTNGDNKIDIADLNAVRNNFGSTGEGDADFDGDADIEDLNLVRNRFGLADERLSISPVPEPSSLVLLAVAATLGSRFRRRS